MSGSHRNPHAGLALLAAALGLSVLLSAWQLTVSPAVCRDGVVFLRYARRVSAALDQQPRNPQAVLDAVRFQDQHPGYPLMVVGVYRSGLPRLAAGLDGVAAWELSARLVGAAGQLLLVVAVWLVGRRLFGALAAGWSALATAALPSLVHTGTDALSDVPGLAVMTLGLWAALRHLDEPSDLLSALAAGALGGAAFLIRPEFAQVVLILLLWRGGQVLLGPGRRAALTAVLITAHAAAGYALPLMALRGSLLPKTGSANALVQHWNRPSADDPALRADPEWRPPLTLNPARIDELILDTGHRAAPLSDKLGRGTRALLGRWAQGLIWAWIPLWALGGAALLVRLRREPSWSAGWLILALAGFQVIYLLGALYVPAGYIASRHLLPVVVLALLPTGLGVVRAAELLERWRQQGSAEPAPPDAPREAEVAPRLRWMLAVAAVPMLVGLLRCAAPVNADKLGLRSAGEWIGERLGPSETLIDPLALAGLYSGRDARNLIHSTHNMPIEDDVLAALAASARREGVPVRYVVIPDSDRRRLRPSRAELPAQLDGRSVREVADFPETDRPDDARRVRVYELLAVPPAGGL